MQHVLLISDGQKSWANGVRQARQSYAVGNIEGLISLDLHTEIWLWYKRPACIAVRYCFRVSRVHPHPSLLRFPVLQSFVKCCKGYKSYQKFKGFRVSQCHVLLHVARRVLPQASRHVRQEPRLSFQTTNRSKIFKNEMYIYKHYRNT